MATENTPVGATPAGGAVPVPDISRSEVRIISRSTLFYWWPIWAVGFLMGLLSLASNQRLAAVPAGTSLALVEKATVTSGGQNTDLEEGRPILVTPMNTKPARLSDPHIHVTNSKAPGVIFCMLLLFVITITNIHFRGLWSVVVIVVLVSLVIILALANVWDTILDWVGILDIRISMGGYFFISTVLFIIWLVVFLFFDPQVYMVFTPGAFRVKQEIGEGETQYDAHGMTLQKVRSDFFRHWILGLGSGDLVVRTTGAQAHEFQLPNVLFIGRKVRLIEDMLRTRVYTSK